jgi:hypothetical protein
VGYYIRFLTRKKRIITRSRLRDALEENGHEVTLELSAGKLRDWTELVLSHPDGREIALIERNHVGGPRTLGVAEIKEFLEETEDAQPASAALWLRKYLRRVKTIYAFQILSGAYVKKGWDAVYCLLDELRLSLGGLTQADDEGFSNEYGFHVLWQFLAGVKGPRNMAVLQDGVWVPFQIQLGNRKHREAFLRGEVPTGVVMLDDDFIFYDF